jgi:uncharacterized repeat protein (TIGR01451 family)
MKKLLLLSIIIAFFGTFIVSAQQQSCGSIFTDQAGISANYANNSNFTTTFCPTNPGEVVTVNFTSFATEQNWDFLKIYDGNTVSSTLIGSFSGTINPGSLTASSVSGCLTFVFTSDSVGNAAGWEASISCGLPSTCPKPLSVSVTNATSQGASVAWTEVGNATQWEVIQVPVGTVPNANSVGIITNSNPYQASSLTLGVVNNFYVRAICSTTDFSAWSNVASVNVPLCAAPTQIAVTNNTTNSVNLSWANPINASSWQVAYQLSTVTTVPTSGTLTSMNTDFLISNLLPGTSYKCYVRADCGNGVFGTWSTAFSFTTLGSVLTVPNCGELFVDNGGLSANYNNNTDSTITIYPSIVGEVVTVNFTTFDTESSWDGLYVYDGNTTLSPQISSGNLAGSVPGGVPGAFWGINIPGPFTSTSADGSLTFRFRSDTSINKPGWSATVICGSPPTCPAPISTVVSAISYNNATISWTATGNNSEWEVLVLPASSSAPTTSSTGIIVTSPTFQAIGLTIGTAYKAYVRSICSITDASLWVNSSIFTTSNCVTPTTISASTITTTSATLSWASTSALQLELLVLPAGTPSPTPNAIGTVAASSVFQASGLTCGTAYVVYARAICTVALSTAWTSMLNFSTSVCLLTSGQPVNLSLCSDSGQTCFMLTDNNNAILANLNPSEYTIAYYSTSANAAAALNPLQSPYCISTGTQTIYAVLTKIATQQKQTLIFSISSRNINSTTVLANLEQCDEDNNGTIEFDLTTRITTSNPLSYYISLVNATSQTNPIVNTSAYSISALSPIITIFIRETIANACDNIYSFQLRAHADCNLPYNCNQANSLCGALGVPFANTHQGISAETGNNYGCLNTTPNPTWFYLPISNSGIINLTVQQNALIDFTGNDFDVDYIVYGPFTNPVDPCSAPLMQSNIVSCSYSVSGIEHPVIPNAQAGQYYLLMTTNFSNQTGFIRITMDTTSQGAIDCSGIRLNAFLDDNNNGTQEPTERNFPLGQFHYDINTANTVHNITAPFGVYTIYDVNPTNSYDVSYSIDAAYSTMYNVSTPGYNDLHVQTGSGMMIYNFPITSVQNYDDLATAIVPLTAPRAGFSYKNIIVYSNLGSQTVASGTVTFNANQGTTISAISQTGTTSITDGFSYNFTDLLPFETRMITVTMYVPPIPTVAIGQLLTNTVSIEPIQTDIVPNNNSNISIQPIIASYDPNDKTEAHGEKILYSTFSNNDYLFYTIRFENTGNASAVDILISDELDSRLDESSVKMIASSHNYLLDRTNSGLIWRFENIQLPVSIADTEIGKGYISFKVKLKPGFDVGDIIPNKAEIYFDFNPAIITNTFNTEFVALLNTASFETDNFLLYPNPTKNTIHVELPNNLGDSIKTVSFYDVIGKSVKQISNSNSNAIMIDVSQLSSGMYFVEIQTENNTKLVKKLIIK